MDLLSIVLARLNSSKANDTILLRNLDDLVNAGQKVSGKTAFSVKDF